MYIVLTTAISSEAAHQGIDVSKASLHKCQTRLDSIVAVGNLLLDILLAGSLELAGHQLYKLVFHVLQHTQAGAHLTRHQLHKLYSMFYDTQVGAHLT